MPRIAKPLSDKEIQNAKPKDKEYSLSDGDGLSLRIVPNGTKTWLFNYYRPHSKKRANLALGKYPVVTLANARKTKTEYKALLAQNIDPQTHIKEQQQKQLDTDTKTIKWTVDQWFEVKKTQVTKDYGEDIYRSFTLHVFPTLGEIPLKDITAPQAIETLKPLAAKGSLETVRRVCQRINEMMNWAVNTGLIQVNPLTGIKAAFSAPKKQNMPALTPDELPELMKALSIASIKLTTRCLIEWQLHTMTRPNESAGARWDEINLDQKLWHIPAHRMKKQRDHKIPLTPQALSLLETMRPISGHLEYIFPADRNPRKHTNEQTANAAIKRMGFKDRLVAHGMRSIASTTLNEQGFDSDLIESALSHIDRDEVRSAYNRAEYIERRRVMMRWWSDFIEDAAKGSVSLAQGNKALKVVNG